MEFVKGWSLQVAVEVEVYVAVRKQSQSSALVINQVMVPLVLHLNKTR